MDEIANIGDFEEKVLGANRPVLVDFYAPWCGPCGLMAPAVLQLSQEFAESADVYKANVDDQRELAERYNVLTIPTFIIFSGGVARETLIGAQPIGVLRSALKKYVR